MTLPLQALSYSAAAYHQRYDGWTAMAVTAQRLLQSAFHVPVLHHQSNAQSRMRALVWRSISILNSAPSRNTKAVRKNHVITTMTIPSEP
jgi:hypothetical protein